MATLFASRSIVPLQIECSCGHRGTVPDEYVGKEIQCPKCKKLLIPLTRDKMENFAARVLFAAPAQAKDKTEEIIPSRTAGPEITFTCPFCSEVYQVSEELAGKKISCRNCREPCKVDAAPVEVEKPSRKKKKGSRSLVLLWIVLTLLLFIVGILLGRISRF